MWLETRVSPVRLSLFGFALFGAGLCLSYWSTPATDFDAMLLPQALRGFGVMFCLLPPTRIALGWLPPDEVPNASGLFNLMRNLGGAIGLALVDTVLFGRIMDHAEAIAAALRAGDRSMAAFVGGLPLERFTGAPFESIDPDIEGEGRAARREGRGRLGHRRGLVAARSVDAGGPRDPCFRAPAAAQRARLRLLIVSRAPLASMI